MISTTVVLDSTPAATPTQTTPEFEPGDFDGLAHAEGEPREKGTGGESGNAAEEEAEVEVELGHSVKEGGAARSEERGKKREDPNPLPPQVPATGPEFWEIQRACWLATPTTSTPPIVPTSQSPLPSSSAPSIPLPSSVSVTVSQQLATARSTINPRHVNDRNTNKDPEPGSSRAKLETLLNISGAEEDDELWKTYLASIHRNLVGGSRLRKGLKLSVVVKVLKAGWIRDGTWAVAAASTSSSQAHITSATTPAATAATSASHNSSFLPSSPYNFIKSAFRSNPPLPNAASPPLIQKALTSTSRSPQGQENQLRNDSPSRDGGEGGGKGGDSSPPKGNWPLRIGRNIANGIVAKKRSIADGARRLSDELRRNSNGPAGSSGNNSPTFGVEGPGGSSPPKANMVEGGVGS